MNKGSVFAVAFLGAAVEVIEMVILMEGVGRIRGWRSTWLGAAAGFAVLAVLVFVLGTALQGVTAWWVLPLAASGVVGVSLCVLPLECGHPRWGTAAGYGVDPSAAVSASVQPGGWRMAAQAVGTSAP